MQRRRAHVPGRLRDRAGSGQPAHRHSILPRRRAGRTGLIDPQTAANVGRSGALPCGSLALLARVTERVKRLFGMVEGECPDGRRAEEPSHVAASE
eukprot:scaffold15829_cov150-Isochrysis_galbana.AAC.2